MTATITNPVLPGFNPDPSILRVGDDYYIATSTFEWFPGVQIHHSRDLVHWRLLTRPLDRVSQLDMRGTNDSGGVWAPCLTHDGERFHLIFTNMRAHAQFKDALNYLVTADAIEGPWSEPIFLNASGFDPSLFHDDDGRKWYTNQLWDPRIENHPFAGIVLQEYDAAAQKLVGPVTNIFAGTERLRTEGPHLYKHGGWYHLMTAEGGTEHAHAVTMARSKTLEGPYELSPHTPTLTADGRDDILLRKAGHGSLVETQSGDWYLAHLCSRPIPPSGRCILGRETALQKVAWDADGWLQLADKGNSPSVEVPAPDLPPHPFEEPPARDDFDADDAAHRLPDAARTAGPRPVVADRAARPPAPARRRVADLPIRAVAHRAADPAPGLRRVDVRRLRPAALPAGRRAHGLLRHGVLLRPGRHPPRGGRPLPHALRHGRGGIQKPPGRARAICPATGPATCGCSCGWATCASGSAPTASTGPTWAPRWTRASCRTSTAWTSASPAPSRACAAWTLPAPGSPPTSTTSPTSRRTSARFRRSPPSPRAARWRRPEPGRPGMPGMPEADHSRSHRSAAERLVGPTWPRHAGAAGRGVAVRGSSRRG